MRPTLCLLLIAFTSGAGCGEGAAPANESAAPPAPPAHAAPPPRAAPPPSPPVTAPAAPPKSPATHPTPEAPPEPVTADSHLAPYAEVLTAIVAPDGLVRYDRLTGPALETALQVAVRLIAAAPLPDETAQRKALWCNAYNANVLALVLRERRKPGFRSVQDVPGFFDREKITVAGETMTLNDLESGKLRPLGDPRIHAAIVCAAMSCPPLRAAPYAADRIEEQLDDQCRDWVRDGRKFRLEEGRLGLSRILDWYGDDFRVKPYGNPIGFVLAYADPAGAVARYIVNMPRPETTWLPYDWSLNEAPDVGHQ